MIIRIDDAGTKLQIISESHRDTLDLAEVLYRLGCGNYKFSYIRPNIFPDFDTKMGPRIEFTKIVEG